MAKGLVVILSGVSSIGKDQVRQKLLDDPELGLMDIIFSDHTAEERNGERRLGLLLC